MKPIKMLGLAALAALMAMAFVGASSAMAGTTRLCAVDQPAQDCSTITHVHETSVGKGKLLSSITVECDVLFLGDTLGESGAPLAIHGNFTYTECGSCVVEEENGPAEIKVLRESHETGSVTGEGLVHVNCSGFINCSYNGVGLKGTAKGPLLSTQANGEVTLSEQTTNKETGGFLCPAKAKLDLTVTPLAKTYISGALLHYCVKYEHNTNGRYEASCKKAVSNGPEDLVVGPSGYKVGDMVCVHLNATKTGLWEAIKSSSECEKDNKVDLSKSLYELGEVILVE